MSGDPAAPSALVIAPLSFPPRNAEAMVNWKMIQALRHAGWRVDVVAATGEEHRYYPGGAPAEGDAVVVREPPRSRLDVLRAAIRNVPFVERFRWAFAAAETGVALWQRQKHDVILSRSIPESAHLAALLVHRRTGVPWIANWNDPPRGHWPAPYTDRSIVWQMAHAPLYRAVAREAAWITFPSERLRALVCARLPAMRSRSAVIPHVALRSLRRPPTRHDGFVLCHAGSLFPPRDPRPLLAGVRRFLDANPGAPLRLRLLADRPETVAAPVAEARLTDRVSIEPPRAYAHVPDVLAEADVLVVVEAPIAEGVFFPSKVVDYVQAGRPLLALGPREGTVADLLRDRGGGLAVDATDPVAIASAVAKLHAAWTRGTLDAEHGSDRLFDLFDEANVVARLADLVREVACLPGREAFAP